jgi:hypothetical protein
VVPFCVEADAFLVSFFHDAIIKEAWYGCKKQVRREQLIDSHAARFGWQIGIDFCE